ncbi:MAG: cytochrome c [Calditrichaeota bacterium]|nr:MAG: cytochrome c [Calditrichota bacterium]
MIVWVGYPLIALSLVVLILSRDPEFSFDIWKTKDANAKQTTAANPSGLSEFELKNGIGPIKKELKVGPIDEALAQKGRQYFKMKCTGCHKLGQRYVGPPLRGVVSFRTPTYIMNMILNPHEMVQKHPVAKGLLAQYLTVMSPQGVTPEMARAILEYLRWDFEKSMQEK